MAASTFSEAGLDRQNSAMYSANRTNQSKSVKELAYKTYIVAAEQSIIIEAWLPETFMLDVNATYEAPFEQGLGSAMPSIGAIARFLGLSLTTQAMTAQVWQGGSAINLSIPLIFQAETDAGTDVMLPIKQLLSLTMPKDPSGGGFLTSPGPRIDINKAKDGLTAAWSKVKDSGAAIAEAWTKSNGAFDTSVATAATAGNAVAKTLSASIVNSVVNNISLYVGQFLYFPSVVITDVSPTYDVILGPDKNPLRASVNVGIRTFYIPTSQDLDLMFPATQTAETLGYGYGTSNRKGL